MTKKPVERGKKYFKAFHWLPFILASLWQQIHMRHSKTPFVHYLFLKKLNNV